MVELLLWRLMGFCALWGLEALRRCGLLQRATNAHCNKNMHKNESVQCIPEGGQTMALDIIRTRGHF